MQTATVEVKYVNPPKSGKQYGSIKDADNNIWPVKKDRIGDFEPNNQYELAYTEADNGFKNIIGVKLVQPEPLLPRGEFAKIEPQGRNGATLMARPVQQVHQEPQSTKASQSEHIFTCGGLYRDIEMGRVSTGEDELVERAVLWRNVYRRVFPE